MINIQVTDEELNTILHGLYMLEDQTWFIGKEPTNKLIKKLNIIQKSNTQKREVVCDI